VTLRHDICALSQSLVALIPTSLLPRSTTAVDGHCNITDICGDDLIVALFQLGLTVAILRPQT